MRKRKKTNMHHQRQKQKVCIDIFHYKLHNLIHEQNIDKTKTSRGRPYSSDRTDHEIMLKDYNLGIFW